MPPLWPLNKSYMIILTNTGPELSADNFENEVENCFAMMLFKNFYTLKSCIKKLVLIVLQVQGQVLEALDTRAR